MAFRRSGVRIPSGPPPFEFSQALTIQSVAVVDDYADDYGEVDRSARGMMRQSGAASAQPVRRQDRFTAGAAISAADYTSTGPGARRSQNRLSAASRAGHCCDGLAAWLRAASACAAAPPVQ
jgi:hypothetical protein